MGRDAVVVDGKSDAALRWEWEGGGNRDPEVWGPQSEKQRWTMGTQHDPCGSLAEPRSAGLRGGAQYIHTAAPG